MLIVEDVIKSIQCHSIQHNDKDAYSVLANVKALSCVLLKNKHCQDQMLIEQTDKMHRDFMEFEKECES